MEKSVPEVYTPEVLIIDDEVEMSEVLRDSLDPKMNVLCFTHAQEAIKRMQSGHWPDVIVLDWVMKGMSGFECLTEIRKSNREVPVIMMSGADDTNMVFDASKLGISCFLIKPFNFEEFETHVHKGILRSRLNKINDHLVRVLGDIVLGLQMTEDKKEAKADIDERLEALTILSAEAEWFIQYRDQTVKEIAGVSI